MNLCPIYISSKRIWLCHEYLLNIGVSEGTLNNWSVRGTCDRIYRDNGRVYVAYDTIPSATKAKLPNAEELYKERDQWFKDAYSNLINREIEQAYNCINIAKWRNIILKEYDLPIEKAVEYGRKASVMEKIVELNRQWKRAGTLEYIFKAYKRLYPDSYSTKSRLCTAIKRAREEGILSVVVDKRMKNSGVSEKYGELHKKYAFAALGHAKGYTQPQAYEVFEELCEAYSLVTPSYRWFQGYYYENRHLIDECAIGKSAWDKDNANYMKIIPALYVGDQWQMDGWRIPIYCKKRNEKGGTEYFVTYNLFAVLDAHSRRIIGYDIAESENTENILKGLERAVETTGILPYEIVADNHSFNKTKEAGNLKADTESLGVTWTIDSNPRRKAILERAFRTLGDKFFKKRYGYIGQGIKTKIKKGITQQELRDIYTKPDNFLTIEQIKLIVIEVIAAYNDTIRPSLQDTPNNRYAKSEQPNAIQIDMFERISLFNRKSEHKIRHGQIRIKRGQHEYEYQLPAEYSARYNGETVGVRYADFDEIYLYDLETNKPICSVTQKVGAHGALANQTDADKTLFIKNSGRMKGINSKRYKAKESIFSPQNTISPDANLNVLLSPKDAVEKVKQSQALRNEALNHGINADMVTPLPFVDEVIDSSMKPRKPKENKHPFAPKNNEIRKISI